MNHRDFIMKKTFNPTFFKSSDYSITVEELQQAGFLARKNGSIIEAYPLSDIYNLRLIIAANNYRIPLRSGLCSVMRDMILASATCKDPSPIFELSKGEKLFSMKLEYFYRNCHYSTDSIIEAEKLFNEHSLSYRDFLTKDRFAEDTIGQLITEEQRKEWNDLDIEVHSKHYPDFIEYLHKLRNMDSHEIYYLSKEIENSLELDKFEKEKKLRYIEFFWHLESKESF